MTEQEPIVLGEDKVIISGVEYDVIDRDEKGRAIVLFNDREAWFYPDTELVKDKATGHIISPPNTNIRSPMQANELARKRWDKYQEESEIAVLERVNSIEGLKLKTTHEAFGRIVGKQAELALDIESGGVSTNAAKFVADALDALPDKRVNRDDVEQPGLQINLSSEAARQLIQVLGEQLHD